MSVGLRRSDIDGCGCGAEVGRARCPVGLAMEGRAAVRSSLSPESPPPAQRADTEDHDQGKQSPGAPCFDKAFALREY